MIKVSTFTFQKLESKNYWASFPNFGECLRTSTDYYKYPNECKLRLNDGKCYQFGMDQSTSCTGIFIKDYENTVAYMIGFAKERGGNAADYIWDLEQLLHRIFEGALVSHIIYEKPIISESYRSSQVLFQLEGMIQQLSRRYEEFKTATVDSIENSAWRRVVILDDYKKSPNRKQATTQSVQRIFRWTDVYGESLGTDQDEYEAIGVFFGWFFNAYDALGRPYVRGDRYHGGVGGFILPGLSAKDVSEQFDQYGIKTRWMMENPRKSIYENLVCGIQKYEAICVELTSLPSMLALTVECNFKWTNPERMVVVLVPTNYVDNRLFEITGKEYHFIV